MIGYEYHPDAEAEYLEAAVYYSRIDERLGMSFVTEVEAAIRRAREFPEACGRIAKDLRHIVTHRFPYVIVYEVMADRILIWAVADGRRRPGYWRGRRG